MFVISYASGLKEKVNFKDRGSRSFPEWGIVQANNYAQGEVKKYPKLRSFTIQEIRDSQLTVIAAQGDYHQPE